MTFDFSVLSFLLSLRQFAGETSFLFLIGPWIWKELSGEMCPDEVANIPSLFFTRLVLDFIILVGVIRAGYYVLALFNCGDLSVCDWWPGRGCTSTARFLSFISSFCCQIRSRRRFEVAQKALVPQGFLLTAGDLYNCSLTFPLVFIHSSLKVTFMIVSAPLFVSLIKADSFILYTCIALVIGDQATSGDIIPFGVSSSLALRFKCYKWLIFDSILSMLLFGV